MEFCTDSIIAPVAISTTASGWVEPITTGLGQAGAGFSVLYRHMSASSPFLRMLRRV